MMSAIGLALQGTGAAIGLWLMAPYDSFSTFVVVNVSYVLVSAGAILYYQGGLDEKDF